MYASSKLTPSTVLFASSNSTKFLPTCTHTVLETRKLKHSSLLKCSRAPAPSRRALIRLKPYKPPIMQWQDCTAKMEVDVPVEVAFEAYLDRESFPRWMPFISSVEVLKDKPELSRWYLKQKAFGQDIEFSWLARNMKPVPNQKIHWRSVDGLPNRGAVRFFPRGPSSCLVELTISYEVPQILTPFSALLQPLLESLLLRGLQQFSTFAKSN